MSRWIEEIRHGLRLSQGGVLILVDHAALEKLGPLVRALLVDEPDLEVLTEVAEIPQVRDGAALVLAPRAGDVEWLNANRPIFARKSLKVVLFCTRDTSEALAQQAPDFYDWISHRQECPAGAAEHALFGIRGALRARAPGIMFVVHRSHHSRPDRIAHVERVFREALPGRRLRWLTPGQTVYATLVQQIREASREWVACDAMGYREVERFRWALAEVRRRTRAILVLSNVYEDRFWVVSDALWRSLADASAQLADAGARHPGRLAAASGLEPPVISALIVLLARGYREEALLDSMVRSADAGAGLAARILSAGIDPNPLQGGYMRAPVQRYLGKYIGLRRKFLSGARWRGSRWFIDVGDDGGFPLLLGRAPDIEWLLCAGARTPERWIDLARLALEHGDTDAAATWAERALATRATSEAYLLHGIARAELGRINWEEGYPGADWLRRDASRSLQKAEETLEASTPSEDVLTLHALRAELLLDLGSPDQAEWPLRRALRLLDLPSARTSDLVRVARSLRQTGRADRAEEILKRALARATDTAERVQVRIELGLNALAQGRIDEADAIAAELFGEKDPQVSDAHAKIRFDLDDLRVRARLARGQLREALETADAALAAATAPYAQLDERAVSRMPRLAESLNRAGRARDAEAVLRKLLGVPIEIDADTVALGLLSRGSLLAFLAAPRVELRMPPSMRDTLWNELVQALRAQGRHLEADDMERRRVNEATPPGT